jgi:NADP-dependent 3-hydroxy acid dehydrogenase YdfG
MNQIQNKVVIVTGGGTGIGQAIAVDFVNAGAKVALVGRRLEKLQETAASLPQDQVMLRACDVADREAVQVMATAVAERFGPVDILVNNAGTNTTPRTVADISFEDWDRLIEVNLTGAFNCVRAVLPGMRAKKDGLIINISSIAGVRAGKLAGAAYSASKHGMMALNHTINEEEMGYNIRACAICPGEVETPILDLRPEPVGAEQRARILQPEDVSAAALMVARLPARACVPLLVIKPTSAVYK